MAKHGVRAGQGRNVQVLGPVPERSPARRGPAARARSRSTSSNRTNQGSSFPFAGKNQRRRLVRARDPGVHIQPERRRAGTLAMMVSLAVK